MTYQVSIFLENKLGHLEKVTAVLKKAEINIRSLHLNHTANGWGILNLVVSNPHLAHKLLSENGMSSALREIVVVKMEDKPGGLDDLLRDIVKAEVNFTNAYGRVVNDGDSAFFVIDVEDITDAREKLLSVGLEIIADHLVYGIPSV
jgi:hypothetical protein